MSNLHWLEYWAVYSYGGYAHILSLLGLKDNMFFSTKNNAIDYVLKECKENDLINTPLKWSKNKNIAGGNVEARAVNESYSAGNYTYKWSIAHRMFDINNFDNMLMDIDNQYYYGNRDIDGIDIKGGREQE